MRNKLISRKLFEEAVVRAIFCGGVDFRSGEAKDWMEKMHARK